MRFKRSITAGTLAVAAITGVTVAGLPASAAQASTLPEAVISVPNVSVTSMNTMNVKGTLTNPGVLHGAYGSGFASWTMKPNANTALGDEWLFLDKNTDTTSFWPGMDPLGTWHAYPDGATNGDDQDIRQNTATFSVKQGSRLSLSAARSGHYVTLTAKATRYNDRLNYGLNGAWQAWPGHTVAFQVQSGRTWTTLASRPAGKPGAVSYRVSSSSARSWRAVDAATGTIWGATSATVRR